MQKFTLLLLTILGTLSCTTGPNSAVCRAGLSLANTTAGFVGAALECKNLSAVQESIVTPVKQYKICTVKEKVALQDKSQIMSAACPIIANVVVKVAGGQIPAKWECSPVHAGEKLYDVVFKSCQKAFGD